MVLSVKLKFGFLLGLFVLPAFADAYTDLDVKLFNAAQAGNTQLIEELLAKGADINIKLGVDQWTPLMTAAKEGRYQAVQLLLENGADPNIRDARFGKSSYHWALQQGHRDIATLLLKNGASKELKKPSRFFSRGMTLAIFLVLAVLIVAVWVIYFLAVVPFLKSNGIFPTAFFMNWRFRRELEGYAQLRQARGNSLAVYHILKYGYYCIFILIIVFVISAFKTCQGNQVRSQYEILKDWHDSNLERQLKE